MPTKKPLKKQSTAKTHEAIQFFKGNRKATDLLEAGDGRKKLKISASAGKVEKKLINFSINHEVIILIIAVALITILVVWFINQ